MFKKYIVLILVLFGVSFLSLIKPTSIDLVFEVIQEISDPKTLDQKHTGLSSKSKKISKNLPITFVKNEGQWKKNIKFAARRGPMVALLENNAITIGAKKQINQQNQTQELTFRLLFEGSNPNVQTVGINQTSGTYNYLIGNNPSHWQTNVRGFEKVLYENVYEGIDVQVREHDNRLEYDLLLDPNADLNQVVIYTEGVENLAIDQRGRLVMKTPLGEVQQTPPTTWYQFPSGERKIVKSKFSIIDNRRFTFVIPNRNKELALVIDPGLDFSTFLGGSSEDNVKAMAIGKNTGDIFLVGETYSSTDFPITGGVVDPMYISNCIPFVFHSESFVTRLHADGSGIVYSTYLGGRCDEVLYDIILTSEEEAIVVGVSGSDDFPTTPGAYDTTHNGILGAGDGVIVKLNATGSSLLYSSFLGGADNHDFITGIAFAPNDQFYLVGYTESSDFPTTIGSYSTVHSGKKDAFAVRFSLATFAPSTEQLIYSTYLGGNDDDEPLDFVETSGKEITILGRTISTNFPTTSGAYDSTFNDPPGILLLHDFFLARLKMDDSLPNDKQLDYSTYFGGTNSEQFGAINVYPRTNHVVFSGNTPSDDFPITHGAYKTTYNGDFSFFGTLGFLGDGFIVRMDLDNALSPSEQLVYSTYLGGSNSDVILNQAIDSSGTITVTGFTASTDFPTTAGAYQVTLKPGISGPTDAIISRLRMDGKGKSDLIYSSFFGGTAGDGGFDLALGTYGSVIFAGTTLSSDLPVTPGAFDKVYNGSDTFITKFDALPLGVLKYGESTNDGFCTDPVSIGVNKMPQDGDDTFAFTASGTPQNATGTLIVGVGKDPTGTPITSGGTLSFIDLTMSIISTDAVTTGPDGYVSTRYPIPIGSQGNQIFAQYFFTCDTGGYVASNALDVTVQ